MVLNQQHGDSVANYRKMLLSAKAKDASIQAALQPWIEMECYQLGRGQQLAQMEILDLGSQQIVRESQTAAVQKLGVMPENLCTLSYCTPDPNFRFSDFAATETDTVFFMPAHTEFDIYVPAGAQTAYVCLNQEEFLDRARTRNPAKWESTPEQLQHLQTTHQAALKHAINLWLNTTSKLSTSSAAVNESQLRYLLLESILQVATAPSSDEPPAQASERARGFNACRMARAFVEANLAVDVVPTITDICRAIGVSERTLQYAFRTYVDMSPIAYLRFCRLNRVRATLRTADPKTTTVTAVAMRFGFLHLGRFAIDYRKLFDESPSTTLSS